MKEAASMSILFPRVFKKGSRNFPEFAWTDFLTPDSKTVFAKTEESLRASIHVGLRVIGDFLNTNARRIRLYTTLQTLQTGNPEYIGFYSYLCL
jgi:hypothetical protein